MSAADVPLGATIGAPTAGARLWNALSLLLIALASAMSLVPFEPAMPAPGLDNSWGFAMGAAVEQGLAFGRDLVFTFGPYAGIYTLIFHPATDAMVLGGTALLALAVTAGLGALTRGWGRLGALMLALFFSQMWLRDAIFFCIPLLFLALACHVAEPPASDAPPRRGTWPALGLLVLALALLPLVKGTFGVASVLVLGLAGLLWLLHGLWWLALGTGLLFLLAMPAFWLLSGQGLADLPRFFVAQGEIIRGYSPAMSLEGPLWQVAAFGAAGLLVLALNLPGLLARGLRVPGPPSRGPWRQRLPGGALLLGSTALLFLAFKAGFVRQDGHVIIAGGTLALLAGVLLLAKPRRPLPWSAFPWAGLAAGLAGWAVLDRAHASSGPAEVLGRATGLARAMARGTATRLDTGALRAAYDTRLALLRQQMPLPATPPGTVDIYSTGQSALLAHGLAWSPRPVLQSYSAYTAPLAALNAAHLAGPRAPDAVLLALEAIDNRLPALEDGPSWPVLLARYAITGREGAMAVLRRRPAGSDPAPNPLREVVASGRHALGARVALPESPRALWATLRLRPSPLGAAMNTLFRLPDVQVTLHLPGGGGLTRRFIAGAGEAGFLMAPLVQDARQFIALAMPGTPVYADQRPVAFTLSVDPQGAGLWQPDYALELRRFEPPAQPGAAAALLLAPAATAAAPAGGRCYLDVVDGVVPDPGRPLALGQQVRLNGWGYSLAPGTEPPRGVEPAALSITLTAPDGTVLSAPAELMPRPDVGAYFGQPGLARVGFQALLDLGALRGGPYRLALGLHQPGGRQDCLLSGTPVRVGEE